MQEAHGGSFSVSRSPEKNPMTAVTDLRGISRKLLLQVSPIAFMLSRALRNSGWISSGRSP
ncbi:MAG TPA: hypothetical protein DD433_02410 [Ruminococcaceae bacterium]|nr:hypothetical protein [Oscillospiraceae bacterium]